MTHILVVEDEPAYRDPLVFRLTQEGFTVSQAGSGSQAVRQLRATSPDLILLDLMLPGLSGLEVCRIAREETSAAIIMVSAKDQEVDKIVGLELGADDYITKPYSYRELLARVRAVLRRRGSQGEAGLDARSEPGADSGGVLEVGPLRLNPEAHEVTLDGQVVQMPLREYELLEYLMDNAGRVLSRGQLLDTVWGLGFCGDPKTLDVHVKRLRSRLGDGEERRLIHTVRGVGYKVQAP